MNRRSFMQSVAAAMAATGIGHTPKVSYAEIDYSKFCGWSYRLDTKTPFSIGERLFATDCRILITHPFAGVVDNEQRTIPPADRLAWDEFDRARWKPLPDLGQAIILEPEQRVPCYCMWELNEVTGREEDKTPWELCEDCGGTGIVVQCHEERLSGLRFGGQHTNLIRSLGAVEYSILDDAKAPGGAVNVMGFRFGTKHGDGRGMLVAISE